MVNKITMMKSDLNDMTFLKMPELQTVRNGFKDIIDANQPFLYRRGAEFSEGKIFLDIDRSGTAGYLTVRVSSQ